MSLPNASSLTKENGWQILQSNYSDGALLSRLKSERGIRVWVLNKTFALQSQVDDTLSIWDAFVPFTWFAPDLQANVKVYIEGPVVIEHANAKIKNFSIRLVECA